MSLIDWRNFSRKPEIKNLPLHQQKKLFEEANRKATENNWFLEYQLVAGASGAAFSGIGVDGPIAGATVISNVGATTTNEAGEFTFASTPTGPITLTGGKDAITGLDFEGELVGYPQYKTISPITTFAHYLKEADAEENEFPMTIDEAVTKTFESSSIFFNDIDLPIESKDIILQKDFIREAIENNNKVGLAAQAVTTQIESIAEIIGVSLPETSDQKDKTEKFGRAGEITEFKPQNRKRTAYAAIGRAARDRGRFDSDHILGAVRYIDPINNRVRTGIENLSNKGAIKSQLDQLAITTRNLSRQEHLDSNFVTTQIQSVNRVQRTAIKTQVQQVVNGTRDGFDKVEKLADEESEKNKLNRISKDKPNEITSKPDGIQNTFFVSAPGSTSRFTQRRFDEKTKQFIKDVEIAIDAAPGFTFFGDVKNNPTLLQNKSPFPIAEFSATRSENFGDENFKTAFFPKTPVTHVLTQDFFSQVTTTTTVLQPFLLSPRDAKSPVGLRIVSQSIRSVTKPNTADHIVDGSVGIYRGILVIGGAKQTPTLQVSETTPRTITITPAESKIAKYILQQNKGGTFEIQDIFSKEILASNLAFVADRIRTSWMEKSTLIDINIRFEKKIDPVQHIRNQKGETYSISRAAPGSPESTFMNLQFNLNGWIELKVTYDSDEIEVKPKDGKAAPNGPFIIIINKVDLGKEFTFDSNGRINFPHPSKLGEYTIQYINENIG